MNNKYYVLNSEDMKIWNEVTEHVRKLKKEQHTVKLRTTKINITNNSVRIDNNVKYNNRQDDNLNFSDSTRVNKSVLRNIKKGKHKIDRILDLHGYTRDQACSEFIKFLDSVYAERCRMVLVITGKGNKSPQNQSILRNSIFKWTKINSNNRILYIDYAHSKHGGQGAFYILLRKQLSCQYY